MKKITVHILCSTGITLIILALAARMSNASFLCISSVFESFAANIVIYLGFLFTRKLESSYAVIEFMVDFGYVAVVLILFGTIFDWFRSTPLWMLIMIGAVVYAAGIFLSMIQMRQDIEEINALLSRRNTESTLIMQKESK